MELLLVWTDMLQLAFVVLAYLAAVAFGAALLRAGWLGRLGGVAFVGLNLMLALTVTAGIILAGDGSAAPARAVYILAITFMVFVLPYLAGESLLRGESGKPTRHLLKEHY